MVEGSSEIELINGLKITIRLVSCFSDSSGPHYYPQAIRAWPIAKAQELEAQYIKLENIYVARLAAMVPACSAYIFSPPSRFPFAGTYRDGCKNPCSLDISARFRKRDEDIVACNKDTTAEDVYRSIEYSPKGDETLITSILMVDDVVASKKTITALFSHLAEAGMPLNAEITVASLLRLRSSQSIRSKSLLSRSIQ
jgi:hypothetical protein